MSFLLKLTCVCQVFALEIVEEKWVVFTATLAGISGTCKPAIAAVLSLGLHLYYLF